MPYVRLVRFFESISHQSTGTLIPPDGLTPDELDAACAVTAVVATAVIPATVNPMITASEATPVATPDHPAWWTRRA
jgi:hypothetical protein